MPTWARCSSIAITGWTSAAARCRWSADGLVLHLNPLQELLQPEGDRDFRGLVDKIAAVVEGLGCPVLVKEVGWGLSESSARRLRTVGVTLLDVAGAGGTSWSTVEGFRAADEAGKRAAAAFADWGIPTAQSIRETRRGAPDAFVVASGGIRTGVEAAKAIALGADAVGFAAPEPAVRSAEVIEYRDTQRCAWPPLYWQPPAFGSAAGPAAGALAWPGITAHPGPSRP